MSLRHRSTYDAIIITQWFIQENKINKFMFFVATYALNLPIITSKATYNRKMGRTCI